MREISFGGYDGLSTYKQFFNMTLETDLSFLDSTCFTCLVITVFVLFSWLENISHIGLSPFFFVFLGHHMIGGVKR